MPLNKSSLAAQLKDLFEGKPAYPADVSEAGRRWASVYRSYAAQALAGPTAPVAAMLSAAEPVLAAALANGFTAAATGGPAALSSAMGSAFAAFWLPVKFAPSPPAPPTVAGVVSLALPATLAGLLAAVFPEGMRLGRQPGRKPMQSLTLLTPGAGR